MKLFKTTLILCLLLSLMFLVVPIRRSQGVIVGGWLTGFQWRKSHIINGSSYGDLTDYAIRVNVHRSAGVDVGEDVYIGDYCQPDFGDCRFTDNLSIALDYFLYNQTSDLAQFWVEIAFIPEYPGNATIYLYFGNSTATTTSNAQASSVHSHGDDFNDQSMNVTLWEIYKQSAVHGVVSENIDGFLQCRSVVGNGLGYVSVNNNLVSGVEISVFVNVSAVGSNSLVISSVHDNDYPNWENNGENYVVMLDNGSDRFIVKRRLSGVKTTRFQQTWNRSTGDNYLRMRLYDGDIKFIEGDYERFSESYALPSYNMYFYIVTIVETDYSNSHEFDSFFIREYVEPEPKHFSVWGSMETSADWAYNDFDYRKHLTLVSYENNLTDYQVRVVARAGSEILSTHGVLGNGVKGGLGAYPTINVSTASLFTPNASGYINQVSVYVDQQGTDYPNLAVAVYANHWNNTFDAPSRPLAIGNGSWVITAGFDGWRTWDLNKTLDVGPNMEYWLICWQVNTTKNYEGCKYYYGGLPQTGQSMVGETFPDWPDPWPYVFPHIAGSTLSIYANLTSESKDDTEEVYLNNHAQNDFDDIRFTWIQSNQLQTPLSYWIDPAFLFAGDNATIWIRVPEIYNRSVSYCWLYYGNATVGNLSSGVDTFDFYDDFDGSDEPPEDWDETQIGSSTWLDISENSYYKVYTFQDDISHWHGNEINQSVSPPLTTKWALEFRSTIKCGVSSVPQHLSWIRLYDGATEKVRWGYSDNWITLKGVLYSWITGSIVQQNYGDAADTFHFEIRSDGTNIKTYWNGTLFQSKAATDSFTNIVIHYVAGRSVAADNPQSLAQMVFLRKNVDPQPTYAWSPEGLHSVTVTYYFTFGGVFQVNSTNVVNGSSAEIYWLSSLDLGALGNTSVTFNNFTISNTLNISTGLNPYLYNFTSDAETVIWCRWIAPPFRYDVFFGALIIIGCIAGLLGAKAKRKI